MRVVCIKCNQAVAGADIDLATNRALCRPCGELFAIPASVGSSMLASSTTVDTSYVPADLKLTEKIDATAARFVLTPSRMAAIPLLIFAAVWNTFLITFYTAMAHSKGPKIAFLFPTLHLFAGIFVTYMGLTRLLNTWRLTLDKSWLELAVGPIPGRGVRVPFDTIDRFDAIESRGSKGSVSWTVRVLTSDEKARKLSLPITQQEHATFIAAKLNHALVTLRTPIGYRG